VTLAVTTVATLFMLSFGVGCSHKAAGGASSATTTREMVPSTTATTTTLPSMGTGGDALYGDYVRPEFGLIKRPANRYSSDEWSVLFPEPGAWKGIVQIAYVGHRKLLGHAYAYEANRNGALRLIGERHRRRLGGGFTCESGQALYAWTRSADYTILRLRPLRDSCAVRRRILTADWSFID
jgi:hypothetical protein